MYRYYAVLGLLIFPFTAFAQGDLQTLMTNIGLFLGNVVVPFLFGIAVLVFVYNVIRYFVLSPADQEGRQKARAFATYSILAFVLIIIFWGVINLLVSTLGLECTQNGSPNIQSDYIFMNVSGPNLPGC